MNNFRYFNPTEIFFGKGSIAKLESLVPKKAKVMLLYGGGSIKTNGVHSQVMKALKKHKVIEFGGIEPNPDYTTLKKALKEVKKEEVNFLLAVGGGSVIDGTKFVALASKYKGKSPWDILCKKGAATQVKKALPFGTVLTLPATGSEFNRGAVISRREKRLKTEFSSDLVFPKFSILDPETTYTLPLKQVRNGIVDAFVHVTEQYLTYPVNAILQDRQAEALLLSLVELAPAAMKTDPCDYDARANLMWAAANALNSLISRGVPQDWATHEIGHEITALYGLDHAETLAAILPSLLRYKKDKKQEKLLQYGERIFGITSGKREDRIEKAIAATEAFFQSLEIPTNLTVYGIDPDEAARIVEKRFDKRGTKLGEHGDIEAKDAAAILRMSKA